MLWRVAKLAESAASDFVRRFQDFWTDPTPERLGMVLSEDVALATPMMPPSKGIDAAKEGWAGMLAVVPDITNVVHRWGVADDGVFIEFTLSGTVGGEQLSWLAVDRFVLNAEGLATERYGFFDPTPVLEALSRA